MNPSLIPHARLARLFLLFSCVGSLTLASSPALSQNNPAPEERSPYTSTAVLTLALVVTSILAHTLSETRSRTLLISSTCSSDLSELSTSTPHLALTAQFIEHNRHALAADLTLAQGPLLSDLLAMLGASQHARRHLLRDHLPSSRRPLMLEALYELDPLAWLDLLLTHPHT